MNDCVGFLSWICHQLIGIEFRVKRSAASRSSFLSGSWYFFDGLVAISCDTNGMEGNPIKKFELLTSSWLFVIFLEDGGVSAEGDSFFLSHCSQPINITLKMQKLRLNFIGVNQWITSWVRRLISSADGGDTWTIQNSSAGKQLWWQSRRLTLCCYLSDFLLKISAQPKSVPWISENHESQPYIFFDQCILFDSRSFTSWIAAGPTCNCFS